MCYQCETKGGKFKNRVTLRRCLLCSFGLIFVVLIGIAAGLLAFYLPDYVKELETTKYRRLADKAGEDINKYVNYTKCSNADDLKAHFKSSLVWLCEDNSCIPEYLRCSGYYDCDDQSDEKNCANYCSESIKAGFSFSCQEATNLTSTYGPTSPECFLSDFKCDGLPDCTNDGDQNDEAECDADLVLPIEIGVVVCSGDNSVVCYEEGIPYCVPDSYRCDGFTYCINGEDELGCED